MNSKKKSAKKATARPKKVKGKLSEKRHDDGPYKMLIEAIADIILIEDYDRKILYANPALERQTGYTLHDYNFPPDNNPFIHPEDHALVIKFIRDFLEKSDVHSEILENRFIDKYGAIHNHSSVLTKIKFFGVNAIQYVVRDITIQKRSAEALRRSNQRFEAVVNHVSEVIAIIGGDGLISYQSPSTTNVLGYTQNELLGTNAFELIHPDDVSKLYATLGDLLQHANGIRSVDFRYKHKNGSWRYLQSNGINLIHNPAIQGLLITSRDITESKLAAVALSQSEEKFRLLAENLPGTVYLCNNDDHLSYIYLSENVEKISGYSAADFLEGRISFTKLYHPDDIRIIESVAKEAIAKRQPYKLSYRILHKNGSWRWMQEIGAGVFHENKIVYLEGFISDFTEVRMAENALQESEMRFRAVFDDSGMGIAISTLSDQKFIQTNPAFQKMIGYLPEELIGKTFSDFTEKDDLNMSVRYYDKLRKGELSRYQIEKRYRHKNGNTVWVRLTTSIMFDAHGQPKWVVGMTEDISAQKIIEDANREREGQYKALVEQALNPVYVLQEGKVAIVNPAWEKLFGYTMAETQEEGFEYLKIIAPESVPMVQERLRKRALGERIANKYELKAITRSGQKLDIEVNVAEILWNNRPAIQGVYYNITERKKAEAELGEEKERLAVTLRSIGDGVITTDVHGHVVLINKAAEILTGWTQEEASGKVLNEVFELYDAKTKVIRENIITKTMQTDQPLKFAENTALMGRDGVERMVADSVAPIRDKDSIIIGSVLVFRDVTEKQKIEEERIKNIKLESVGVLAGGIAHDFNNILTAILGNISLAKMEQDSGHYVKVNEILTRSEKATYRARDLTHQLLTFAKGGAPIRKITALGDLLKESSELMTRGTNISCQFDFAPDLHFVEIDEGQFSQVIYNLTINAVDAMPNGGKIVLQTKNIHLSEFNILNIPEGDYACVLIKDSGVGIPQKNLAKIFDPYFTTKQKGSGLGLASSYAIIKNHGGTIRVESEVGEGSTFSIYIPAALTTVASPEVKNLPEGGESIIAKIMIMDDEEDIRDVCIRFLSRVGHAVDGAASGEEAIEKYKIALAANKPYDLVIMDLTIPGGMGGKETIVKLKEINPKVKAVVSSGYSNDPIMADYKKFGFEGYVVKPFRIEEFRALLQDILVRDQRG